MISNKTPVDVKVRAIELKKYEKSCAGDGFYFATLSSLFQQAGMLDDAGRAASAGLKTINEFRPNLLNISALIKFDKGDISGAYKLAVQVTKEYPQYPKIYVLLSQIDASQNRLEEAY